MLGRVTHVSFDVIVWGGPPLTAEELEERLRLLDEGDIDETSLFTRSETLVRWRNHLLKRYPALEDFADDGHGSPWAMTPVESARFVELNLRWSVAEEQLLDILRSASRVGLYIYDPQGPLVVRPGPARWQLMLRRVGLGRFAGPDP